MSVHVPVGFPGDYHEVSKIHKVRVGYGVDLHIPGGRG